MLNRLAIVLAAVTAMFAHEAEAKDMPPPACWFYTYVWTSYNIIHGTSERRDNVYMLNGMGTGVTVTSGGRPDEFERLKLNEWVASQIPQGDSSKKSEAQVVRIVDVPCPENWRQIQGLSPEFLKKYIGSPH